LPDGSSGLQAAQVAASYDTSGSWKGYTKSAGGRSHPPSAVILPKQYDGAPGTNPDEPGLYSKDFGRKKLKTKRMPATERLTVN
jgi:hypothetical protein